MALVFENTLKSLQMTDPPSKEVPCTKFEVGASDLLVTSSLAFITVSESWKRE